ncbi:MAG: cupin domain-containing protein [Chlamydiota bacterium]|nr:cupin domain-containing protein [Chlamydiota bacterium]
METITIEHNPTVEKLKTMGVLQWPIWTKETSVFPWTYDSSETCYILEGKITVTPDGGKPVDINAGDLVVFHKGLSCTWKIKENVRKHYQFR